MYIHMFWQDYAADGSAADGSAADVAGSGRSYWVALLV